MIIILWVILTLSSYVCLLLLVAIHVVCMYVVCFLLKYNSVHRDIQNQSLKTVQLHWHFKHVHVTFSEETFCEVKCELYLYVK